MPATRPSSPKSRKSKVYSTSSSPSSQPKAVKRFTCRAWWCNSAFGRRADMMKHVGTEHFGRRYYCPICFAVMKQGSNMNTHLNTHLSNHCTICSCGQGFTDPSAYTKHRDILGHEKGTTHGKPRPTIVGGIKVQHVAGLNLTLETISNPTFVPPPFDASYHLKGMAKPKAQEKYNQLDYVTIELPGPAIPSTTAAQPSPTDSVAKYQEAEAPTPMQTEIQVDKLGIDTNFSYDVVLPQEPQDGQVVNPGAYSGCPDPSLPYPIDCPNTPLDDHFVPQQSTPCCYSPLDAAANATYVTNNVTNVSVNATFLPSNPVNTTYIPPNSYSHQYQPFVGSYEQQEYRGAFYTPQASKPVPWSMPLPLVGVSQHDFFQQVGFGMHGREQFQQPSYRQPPFLPSYYPNFGFNSQVYHPAIEAY